MSKFLFTALIFVSLHSCVNDNWIARQSDYNAFLSTETFDKKKAVIRDEIDFWAARLKADTGSFVNMLELAYRFIQQFEISGDATVLHTADSLFNRSSLKLDHGDASIFFARTQNAITRHQFSEAYAYLLEAENKDASAETIKLLKFDTGMELGLFEESASSLDQVYNKTGFDYLLRKAKLEDQLGNLDRSISLVETALARYEKQSESAAYRWLLSNLADMYGHAGRVGEAYQAYLEVLKADSSNIHCLQGIAWIAFSHDGNSEGAKRIINRILTIRPMPDLYLDLAEIEEYEGNMHKANAYLDSFVNLATRPEYGIMYRRQLAELFAGELADPVKALKLAREELIERPTPQSYSLLAWVLYQQDKKEEALNLVEISPAMRDHEPVALMHSAFIYEANGQHGKARELLNECLESEFELGPLQMRLVRKKLDDSL